MRLGLLCLLYFSLASNAQAITLPEALAQADGRAEVIAAQLTLDNAKLALERSQADPLALSPDLLRAEQALELAQIRLEQARYNAYLEITESYTQALEAEARLALTNQSRALAEQALRIARIRAERGGVTGLELREAELNVDDAQQAVTAATDALQLARTQLASLTGLPPDALSPITELLPESLPSAETLYGQLTRQPLLVELRQGLELAELGRYLLDPSFAPQAELDTAEARIEQAQGALRETQRSLNLQISGLYTQVQTAQQALELARDALDNRQTRESVEQQRLEAGLIAEISFRQAQLETAEAALRLLEREHSYLLALLRLQALTLVPTEGLHGF